MAGVTLNGYIDRFPEAVTDARNEPVLQMAAGTDPYRQFWAILRDAEPVAMVNAWEGKLYRQGGPTVRLSEQYEVLGRRVTPLVCGMLQQWLP
ncbi:hypothetical protein DTO57_14145 [Microbacterium sorbitolivorans]|uniref:T3SS peptide-binding chaperone domain-containing protein n=2 Tax=Microbacterium sorbitolivorans TaxID=1867410 RepID=A0A367XU54_9MICO|nr:hypothetical protein DTO57_14145 [Microbacterium sorbitolivorans]